jgi:hypothetical protein
MRLRSRRQAALLAAAAATALPVFARGQDVSAQPILQIFEASYKTIERRAPDIFMAGYGGIWTPPPGRAEQGNLSVGYDVYDRFDLGSAGNPTMYGTETGLKTTVQEMHRSGVNVYTDMVWNHNGFADLGTPGFQQSGGYPGFVLTRPDAIDGDFHSAYDTGDYYGRTSNLIDIAHETAFNYVRNPVPGFANNLPAGATGSSYAGGTRVANVPTESNRRFYPDAQGTPKVVNGVTYYPFSSDPTAGDPYAENATGYLMRHTRWMVDVIGVDGFRLDATKHLVQFFDRNGNPVSNPDWVLEFYDQAVNAGTATPLLDGSKKRVFSFGEFLDTNIGKVQASIKKDANANRDALDFNVHYALKNNLTNNGFSNDWRNVVDDSLDKGDDGLANNGSQGVAFDASHDDGGAYLGNVANAYTLMRPGNAVVYFNAKEFGSGRNFPRDGRGDALGGLYGDTITKLVDIRNRYGRGNYNRRILEKETLVFERENSLIAGYSNRLDGGYDQRTFNTAFKQGMRLIELTGNASNLSVDPNQNNGTLGDIYDVVTVGANGSVTIRVPRNANSNGVAHDKGYVMYGPATPRGTLSLTNVAKTLGPETPTSSTNGTARLTAIDVIKTDSFQVQLNTTQVILPDGYRDLDAEGDSAKLRFDGGIDVNGNGVVDTVTPGDVAYGFETFQTKSSPRFGGGDGQFLQTVDASKLAEGYHYITARAFRHRDPNPNVDGGPAVWSDFKKVVYVDRLRPVSAIDRLQPINGATNADRDVVVRSTDKTATGVAVFYNLGANQFTDAQLVQMAASGQGSAGEYDRDLWKYGIFGWKNGNNALTVVTFETTYDPSLGFAGGGVNVQRFGGIGFTTGAGRGLGDADYNGTFTSSDPNTFYAVVRSNGASFNAASDLNADGLVNEADSLLYLPWLTSNGADANTIGTATAWRLTRALETDGTLYVAGGTLDVSGTAVQGVPITFNSGFNISANKTLTKTGAQMLNVNGTQAHGANATLVTAAGTTNLNSDGGTNLLVSTTGAGSATNFSVTQHLRGLSVSSGGAAKLTTSTGPNVNGGKVIVTKSLAADSGKVDLTNNNLAVDYAAGGSSPLADVNGLLAAGYAGGSWNGATGVASSSAAGNSSRSTLAVAEASDVLHLTGTQTTLWFGQSVDATTVLVRYTFAGDADLNGKLDGDDYFRLDAHVGESGPGVRYADGDFDFNGRVNGDDYFILDRNVSTNGFATGMDTAASQGISGITAVPEPTVGAIMMMIAGYGVAPRRRRRRRIETRTKSHER